MTRTSIRFHSQQAPCGRICDGEHFDVEDDQGLVTDEMFYACGCESLRQEYHDGSFYRKVVHHNGRVLIDEFAFEHGT